MSERDEWTDRDGDEPQLLLAGMSDETADPVLAEMARRKAAGLPEVPGDWDD